MRVDYESSTTNAQDSNSMVGGLTCSNKNRLVSSTCSISKSYAKDMTTSYSISTEYSTESEYSWGSSSTVTTGWSQGQSSSVETTDEFSFGFEQSVSVGVEVDALFVSVSTEIELGSNQQWTSSETMGSEKSSSISGENGETTEEGQSQSSGSSTSSESSWECTETKTLECAAEMEVPPGHEIEYKLVFNAYNTTLITYNDLKLTLCSALISPGAAGNESNYIYIRDVPGSLYHSESISCDVSFGPATPLQNEVPCDQEAKLAVASGATYIPRCDSTDSSLYDGCQCDIGDSLTMGVCWCSDESGNQLNGEIHQFGDEVSSFEEVCSEILKCSDSDVEWIPDTLTDADTNGDADTSRTLRTRYTQKSQDAAVGLRDGFALSLESNQSNLNMFFRFFCLVVILMFAGLVLLSVMFYVLTKRRNSDYSKLAHGAWTDSEDARNGLNV